MNKEMKAYIDLARILESEFHERQDAGILANLIKRILKDYMSPERKF